MWGNLFMWKYLKVDTETAQIYCALCHILPDKSSRLITYGLTNLNGKFKYEISIQNIKCLLNILALEPSRKLELGKVYKVTLKLDTIGKQFTTQTLFATLGPNPTVLAKPVGATTWLYNQQTPQICGRTSNPPVHMADSLWHEDEVRVEKTSNIYFDIEQ